MFYVVLSRILLSVKMKKKKKTARNITNNIVISSLAFYFDWHLIRLSALYLLQVNKRSPFVTLRKNNFVSLSLSLDFIHHINQIVFTQHIASSG